jgi:hypothetical protein
MTNGECGDCYANDLIPEGRRSEEEVWQNYEKTQKVKESTKLQSHEDC